MAAAEQGHSNFIKSDFGHTVSRVYSHGAGMFVAADLESIFATMITGRSRLAGSATSGM